MKRLLLITAVLMVASLAFGQLIINEIDYDQPSTDAAEYIELAGPAGTYNNVVVDLVNGNDGASYKTITVGNITLADESAGYGFYVIGVAAVTNVDFTVTPETNLIQNGSPDGVQLKVDGVIVDAVAYEGSLNDLSGNAMEVASTDYEDKWVGAADTSLSRIGLDSSPWVATANTPGAINTGQILSAGTNYPPVADAGPDQLVMVSTLVTLDGSNSSDPNDNIMSYEWAMVWGTQVSPTLTDANTAVATFTAPATTQDFQFELTVTDSVGEVSRDTVAIAVREPQDSKLIISEYIEGSSNNKAIELYNLDSNSVNMDGYVVKKASNGEGWATASELELSGMIEGHGVYVIANDEAIQAILDIADTTSSVTWFNGDDAIGLFLNGVLVDIFGDPNDGSVKFEVAGVAGAALDHTLIRKASIETANANWASSAGTNADNSEWVIYDMDYTSDLGSHTAGPVAFNFSNNTVTTTFPQAGSEISISVDITPDEGVSAPTTIKVWYGFDGTQANSADMWLESGTTYNGIIPSLAQGNKVLDYYVSASGGGETINSALYSVVVAGSVTDISDIHTNIGTYDGQLKTIEGVITIGAGILRDDRTSCYIQDESGRGLNLYATSLYADLTRGTKVKLVGEVDAYFTTVEVKDFSYTVVSTGNTLPDANSVDVVGANSADHEGTLTTVTGTFAELQDYSTSKNMILVTGTDSAIVKVWPTTGIDPSSYTIGENYAITGVGSQYYDDYQLLVGYASDIIETNGICDDCIPTEFGLDKAYPNPFNPSTTIEFSLMEASDMTISVYNIAGQRVDVLMSGYAEPGVYRQVWNAANFTSGVYFIRLEAGTNIATQKVVLIK